jgi:hypothetical protein
VIDLSPIPQGINAQEAVDLITYRQYRGYREMGIAAERLFFYSDTEREKLEAKYREEKRAA